MKKLTKTVIGIVAIVVSVVGFDVVKGSHSYGEISNYNQQPVAGGKYVQTQLGRLFVKDVGTGDTTLVLWPSLFTDHRIYDQLTDQLSSKYRFLLIDGPGHGRSRGPETEFTIKQSADAMAAILDYYKIDKAVVGGTSWGGMTGAELSLSQPDRVQALILMNTPMKNGANNSGIMESFISFGARYGLKSWLFRNGTASNFFSPETMQSNPEFTESFHAMLKGADASQLSAAIRSVLYADSALIERMADITVPALVIAGKKDDLYPVEVQSEAAKLAKQGEFAAIDGKHISVVERPQQVAKSIDQFVQRVRE